MMEKWERGGIEVGGRKRGIFAHMKRTRANSLLYFGMKERDVEWKGESFEESTDILTEGREGGRYLQFNPMCFCY